MFPRWLSWLVVVVLAYLMVQGSRQQQVAPQPGVAPAPQVTESLQQATDLERWKKAVNPHYAARSDCAWQSPTGDTPVLTWKVLEEQPGNGAPAQCTDTMNLTLTVWNAQGSAAYTGEETLTLGEHRLGAGLDAALEGMRPGAVRTVILGPEALKRDAKAAALPKPLAAALGKNRVVILTARRG